MPSSLRVAGLGVNGRFRGANFHGAETDCIMGQNLRIETDGMTGNKNL